MFTYKIEIKRKKKEKDKNDTRTQNHAYIVKIDKYITKHTHKSYLTVSNTVTFMTSL